MWFLSADLNLPMLWRAFHILRTMEVRGSMESRKQDGWMHSFFSFPSRFSRIFMANWLLSLHFPLKEGIMDSAHSFLIFFVNEINMREQNPFDDCVFLPHWTYVAEVLWKQREKYKTTIFRIWWFNNFGEIRLNPSLYLAWFFLEKCAHFRTGSVLGHPRKTDPRRPH